MREAEPPIKEAQVSHASAYSLCGLLFVVSLLSCIGSDCRAAEPSRADLKFFEQQIQPVLVAHCYECHSTKAAANKKLKGGLRVDSREALRAGGESGAAVVPGNVKQSLLISALRHEDWQMPPKGKLPESVIADFVKWIELGAPDPRTESTPAPASSESKPSTSNHWAFQPRQAVVVPNIPNDDWSQNGIDRFILAKLQQHGLRPSPEADRLTLLRRVTFDLIGLPPTLEQIDEFVADTSPDAYERLIDRLLASPHYGERWGRHWLDLARYADSSGFHNDLDRPTAWRYRDYVIQSFNNDKPYARFVAEQLAGDELEPRSDESVIATGFCRNGPSNDDNMGNDKEKYRLDQLDDVISTTSSVFLGLTLGCARCHDHKYDPLPTEDYYRFLAIFNNTEKLAAPKPDKDSKPKEAVVPLLALVETSAKSRPTFILRRGNNKTPGSQVEPGVPTALTQAALKFPEPSPEAKATGRRRTLAAWITSPDNALSYRVLANRLWQHHFGRGIVETTSNFGVNGARPTHPELLDDLANQIIQHDGQLKAIHKLIVTSATYRQASSHDSTSQQLDPQNQWLWRMNPRRLEAELLRDSVLAVSGNLNQQMSGPGIKPRMRADLITASQRNKWPAIETERPEHWRRSVYIYVKRQLLMPMMELFDAPTTTETCAVRSESVVPTQALVLMNDEFIEDQAGYLAQRIQRESHGELATAIDLAHRLTLARKPTSARRQQAVAFIEQQEQTYRANKLSPQQSREKALVDLCHVLMNSSEFVFVE